MRGSEKAIDNSLVLSQDLKQVVVGVFFMVSGSWIQIWTACQLKSASPPLVLMRGLSSSCFSWDLQ